MKSGFIQANYWHNDRFIEVVVFPLSSRRLPVENQVRKKTIKNIFKKNKGAVGAPEEKILIFWAEAPGKFGELYARVSLFDAVLPNVSLLTNRITINYPNWTSTFLPLFHIFQKWYFTPPKKKIKMQRILVPLVLVKILRGHFKRV